jgi:hypothetical protein
LVEILEHEQLKDSAVAPITLVFYDKMMRKKIKTESQVKTRRDWLVNYTYRCIDLLLMITGQTFLDIMLQSLSINTSTTIACSSWRPALLDSCK